MTQLFIPLLHLLQLFLSTDLNHRHMIKHIKSLLHTQKFVSFYNWSNKELGQTKSLEEWTILCVLVLSFNDVFILSVFRKDWTYTGLEGWVV